MAERSNPKEVRAIESHALSAYDTLASKYYTSAHPTSRVFDFIIVNYLRNHPLRLDPSRFSLDVGCGKTKFFEVANRPSGSLVLLDISRKMLHHSREAKRDHLIVASAFELPIATSTLVGVYSFMGDPFGTIEFFREAFRVLETSGELLYIAPNHVWALTLRQALGIKPELTTFPSEGPDFTAPSITYPGIFLREKLVEIGFADAQFEDLFLTPAYPEKVLPEHIMIPSRILGLEPYTTPLLTVIRGMK